MFRQTGAIDRWFLELPKPPIIKITADAYAMSMAYVDGCKKEIGWLCHVSEIDGEYVIDNCFLPEQEVAGATCEFTEAGTSQIMTEVIQTKGIEYYNQIRCWAHSHVDMAARPSGQDKQQILKWKENDYFIMLITNKKGEFYAEFYDFKNKVAFNNLSVELYHPDQDSYNKKAAEEIREKVSDIKPPNSKFVVRGTRNTPGQNIPGQMSFISNIVSDRNDRFNAIMSAQRDLNSKYPKSLVINEDEECVYERPPMKVIPPTYLDDEYEADFDEENEAEDLYMIPSINGDWIEGEDITDFNLWEFSKFVYELGRRYPTKVTYDKVLDAILQPTSGSFDDEVVAELHKYVTDNLSRPGRAYIFNRAFNHDTYDDEVKALIDEVMGSDTYRSCVAIAVEDEDGLFSEGFCKDLMDTYEVDEQVVQEAILMLPMFFALSYSDKIKDSDELEFFVENLINEKWVQLFVEEDK
jgi:hypothetical protein